MRKFYISASFIALLRFLAPTFYLQNYQSIVKAFFKMSNLL
jgi:hypothetical protein